MRRIAPMILAALALAAVAATPASASTVAECQAIIDTLAGQTQAAPFTGRRAAADRDGLLGKLADAGEKLGQAKPADAITKLTQYRDKVVTLSGEGKLDPAAAATLAAGADETIVCLGLLGA